MFKFGSADTRIGCTCLYIYIYIYIHILSWIPDSIDILAVAIILYQLYRLTRGTAAIRIFIGVLAIYLVYQIVDALEMRMLAEIMGQFIGVGVIALLIVFQQFEYPILYKSSIRIQIFRCWQLLLFIRF